MSRRRFLKLGSMAVAGLSTSNILPYRMQSAASANTPDNDTAVIMIWLPGGPPHMETYDMKPDAPSEWAGAFKPIHTNVPGIDVCEHLPLHAKIADKYTLIRSVAHNFADHGGGHKRFLTGRDPQSPVGFENDYPMVGSMVSKVRDRIKRGVPNYVCGTDGGRSHIDVYSFGSSYLGPSTHPFMVIGDPSMPGFKVQNLKPSPGTEERLPDRLALLSKLDRADPSHDITGQMSAMDYNRSRGLSLFATDDARKAFDLSSEPQGLRERYGMHPWGQRALLARRLVEAGASFVTMVMENPSYKDNPFPKNSTYNWDSHAVNCHLFDDALFRLPHYDRAITALIEDLYARGLDKKVLLIVTGEFGRTPKISYSNGSQTGIKQPGRDHWPQAMSILLSGGGIRTGQVIGSTNSKGEHPKDKPMTPNDLWATMFQHLGIDYNNTSFIDHSGRPMPILPYGNVIADLY